MTIYYMVSRSVRKPHARTRIETKRGRLRWRGNWDSDKSHAALRKRIREKEPGWMVAMYGPRTLNARDSQSRAR